MLCADENLLRQPLCTLPTRAAKHFSIIVINYRVIYTQISFVHVYFSLLLLLLCLGTHKMLVHFINLHAARWATQRLFAKISFPRNLRYVHSYRENCSWGNAMFLIKTYRNSALFTPTFFYGVSIGADLTLVHVLERPTYRKCVLFALLSLIAKFRSF